uniref:DUF4397 domain-containing protein n=1 Tax=Trichocoleus desertorum TaxID=1481672 RepID=UPI0025B58301|nr:DUF4397 domain-containing protein [Trichocoleus desertorum]
MPLRHQGWMLLSVLATGVGLAMPSQAESLAYVNYWLLDAKPTVKTLHLNQQPIHASYSPEQIIPSQRIPAGKYTLSLNSFSSQPESQTESQPKQSFNLEAEQFYTVALFQKGQVLQGIVLNDKLSRPEPTVRLVNLMPEPVQVTINQAQAKGLELQSGEQKDVAIAINSASKVGLVTVKTTAKNLSRSVTKTLGVGPDYASVVVISPQANSLRLTRWQYDRCAVRIETYQYEDACGHSD